jgi:hypothetical protein
MKNKQRTMQYAINNGDNSLKGNDKISSRLPLALRKGESPWWPFFCYINWIFIPENLQITTQIYLLEVNFTEPDVKDIIPEHCEDSLKHSTAPCK